MKTVPVKVVSATELTEQQLSKIKSAVKTKYSDSTVTIETKLDPSVIGGVKLLVNTVEYDATVSGKLDQLQHHLADKLSNN